MSFDQQMNTLNEAISVCPKADSVDSRPKCGAELRLCGPNALVFILEPSSAVSGPRSGPGRDQLPQWRASPYKSIC